MMGLALVPLFLWAEDDEPGVATQEILNKYVQATQVQQQVLRGITMKVNIVAELPRLQKKGTMIALRTISRVGRTTYEALGFEGDNTIKQQLIARYLAAETDASNHRAPPITPEFYKFKYKGLLEREGQQVHLFQLSPKKKAVGTFKGELWLDKQTCLPLRESGRLSRNPSLFIKTFDFVRRYEIRDGIAYPKQTLGTVVTRIWGKAEMNVDYSNYDKLPTDAAESTTVDDALAKNPR
ncbi:MAG TPA: hypothetical protein VM120_26240 [Bryobacteraceae bacterium]|nr:hypothetical protein [Bryobacteraceae bacterium]